MIPERLRHTCPALMLMADDTDGRIELEKLREAWEEEWKDRHLEAYVPQADFEARDRRVTELEAAIKKAFEKFAEVWRNLEDA